MMFNFAYSRWDTREMEKHLEVLKRYVVAVPEVPESIPNWNLNPNYETSNVVS